MADLSELQSSQSVKIAGANPSTGIETNWMQIDSNGSSYSLLKDASGTAITSTSISEKNTLDVNVVGSAATGVADKTAFVYGTTIQQIIGGVYQDTSPALTAGQQGAARLTANRALHANLRDASGTELGTVGNPVNVTGTTTGTATISGTVTVIGTGNGYPVNTFPQAPVSSNSYPNPISAYPDPTITANDYNLTLDVFDNLQVRGPVITDEGSFRDDFIGSSLFTPLTGQVKFANNSLAFLGNGTSTLFTSEVSSGFYVRKVGDPEANLIQIDYVQDASTAYAQSNYASNQNNVSGEISRWKTATPSGGTMSVANSVLSLSSGTINANVASIQNQGDYLPYSLQFYAALTQRVANNTTIVGFQNTVGTGAAIQAVALFDGTDNTKVKFRSSSSAASADRQETTVTLPGGAVTSSYNTYEIDLQGDLAALFINGVLVATHDIHIPGPYDTLVVTANMTNSAVVTATTLTLDYINWANQDRLNIGNDQNADPVSVRQVEDVHTLFGALTTTAVTADQVIASITVPTGKSLYILGYKVSSSNIAATVIKIGKNTVTTETAAPGASDVNFFRAFPMAANGQDADRPAQPIRFAYSGDVVKITVTPSAVTSTIWRASLDYSLR